MDFYEQQANLMRNVPGLSIADANFIDHWVERARASDRQHITSWVTKRRAENKAKAADVLDRINALQDKFVDIRKKAERNEVPWTELAKQQRRIVGERVTLEKVYESLSASEAGSTRMEADPSGYLNEFYSRFPTLNDRRPNLQLDLAEDQQKRGAKAIS